MSSRIKRTILSVLMAAMLLCTTGCSRDKISSTGSKGSSAVTSDGNAAVPAEGEEMTGEGGEVSTVDTEPESDTTGGRYNLIGTGLSWDIPAGFSVDELETGFVCYNKESSTGVTVRSRLITKDRPDFATDEKLSDEILKSRVAEVVKESKIAVKNGKLSAIKIAGLPGFLYRADFAGASSESSLMVIAMQYETEMVIIAGTCPATDDTTLLTIMNSVIARDEITTILKEV